MLAKKNRADRKTIENIFKNGVFINSANISLKFISSKSPAPAQISFITPKTVSKKAVVRNQLRRRGYAAVRKYFNKFPPGFVGAFIFGKKSGAMFGGEKTKQYNPILNLENEIQIILGKLH